MTTFTATTHEAATIARVGIGGTVAIVRRLKVQPPSLDDKIEAVFKLLSPGKPVWVKEAHYLTDDGDEECVVWAQDEDAVAGHLDAIRRMQASLSLSNEWASPHLRLRQAGWMPRWASRHTLTPETVRVCRVRDCAPADGVMFQRVHGDKAFDANPWVMVALCKIGGVE